MIDVVVLGAGPAGALAARELARCGRRVRLLDKATFPRNKVCGATLNGHALSTLHAAGLGDLPQALGALELRRCEVLHRGRSITLPLAHHRSLSRGALDHALIEAARACGVEVTTGCSGRITRADGSGVEIEIAGDRSNETIRAAALVAADGLASRALGEAHVADHSRIGAAAIIERCPDTEPGAELHPLSMDDESRERGSESPSDPSPEMPHPRTPLTHFAERIDSRRTSSRHGYPLGSLTMAVGRTGYVGIVGLEDGRLDVAAALEKNAAKAGLAPSVAQILDEAGAPPVPALADATFLGVPALTRTRDCVARDRVFAIGDAAGYVEPFTGEGIGWALESGLMVAPFVCARIAGSREADRAYAAAYRRAIGARQRMCRAIAWTLRHPTMIALAMHALMTFSSLGRAVLSHLDAGPRGVRA